MWFEAKTTNKPTTALAAVQVHSESDVGDDEIDSPRKTSPRIESTINPGVMAANDPKEKERLAENLFSTPEAPVEQVNYELDDRELKQEVTPLPDFKENWRRANICSKLFYCFITPILSETNKNNGSVTDDMIVAMTDKDDQSKKEAEDFLKGVNENYQKWKQSNPQKKRKDAPWPKFLQNQTVSSVKGVFYLTGIVFTIAEAMSVVYSYMLLYLIDFLKDDEAPFNYGLQLAFIFIALIFVSAILRNAYIASGYYMAVRVRSILSSIMYDRIGQLSLRSLTECNSGKLVTIVSSDIAAIERTLTFAPLVIFAPLVAGFTIFLIGVVSTWQDALIIGVLWILTVIFSFCSSGVQKNIKGLEAIENDNRMKLVNDMITGIRTIKSYAWESHYLKKIKEMRARQAKKLYQFNIVGSLSFSLFNNFGFIGVLIIFLMKWYKGEMIEPGQSFAMLAMVFFLFYTITTFIVFAAAAVMQFLVVIRRLADIFELEEFKRGYETNVPREKVGVKFENAAFKWGFRISTDQSKTTGMSKVAIEEVEEPTISKLDFEMKHDSTLMICGKIGCGKTTLLHAIMSETSHCGGNFEVRGKVAYVEQEPFIISGSIKKNICFGLEYDQERFETAVYASCFERDLQNMANGADTVIGERGVNVSGGQKARISLARAIYQNADIYLLDDPLSAVDPEVAKLIIERAINGVLKNRCVFIVTHQLQFMRMVPRSLVLVDGKQHLLGSYQQLLSQGFDIDEILQAFTASKKEKEQSKKGQKTDQTVQLADETRMERDKNLDKLKKVSAYFKKKRQNAVKEFEEEDDGEKKKVAELITPEEKIMGSVTFKDYVTFMNFGLGCSGIVIFLVINILAAVAQIALSYFLAEWTGKDYSGQQMTFYPVAFAISIGIFMFLVMIRVIIVYAIFLMSTTNMHNAMAEKVLRAAVLFFDSNPIGRITTRFTKDVVMLDLMMPPIAVFTAIGAFRVIFIFITVALINPWLLIALAIGMVGIKIIYEYGISCTIDSQRMVNVFNAPVNSALQMEVAGLVTLRAFDRLTYFKQDFSNNLEKGCNITFNYIVSSRWMGIRFDMISGVFVTVATLLTVYSKGKVASELLIITLQIVIELMGMLSIVVRMYGEVQQMMTASQRMNEYTKLPSEDLLEKEADKQLAIEEWPTSGKIEFKNITMKYREELEPAVKGLSVSVQPGMKVGICGRTGSGKSSILQTLFRLTDVSDGTIKIDGTDIYGIGLHALRKNIAFIPQTPFLLQGSIRENLDPHDERTDQEVAKVLLDMGLKEKIDALPEQLDTQCNESNNLFSMGQKQLLCMGRAIIRNSKMLVLDEATANVDLETDNLIQKALRQKFKDCTVLVIAHRLATIIDSDRILVMGDGNALEYDHPYRLLVERVGDTTITNHDGHFAQMVLATGMETAQSLFEIAREHYQQQGQKYKQFQKNTLSVKDNRTQKAYDFQIEDGCLRIDDVKRIVGKDGSTLSFSDPNMHSTVLYHSDVLQFTANRFQIRAAKFQDFKNQKLAQFIPYLFNSQEVDKNGNRESSIFENVQSLDFLDQLKTSTNPLLTLSEIGYQSDEGCLAEVAPVLHTLAEALLGTSLWEADDSLSKLMILMFDFEMRPTRVMLRQAVVMGKPLAQALQMANLCYDRRRESAITTVVQSLDEDRQPTSEESNFLIQSFSYRDPRMEFVKKWVYDLCQDKNVSQKFEKLTELMEIAAETHPDSHHMEGHISAYIVLAMDVLGLIQQEKQLFLLAKVVPWIFFYQELAKREGVKGEEIRPKSMYNGPRM